MQLQRIEQLAISFNLLFPNPGNELFTAALNDLLAGKTENALNALAADPVPFRQRLDKALLKALAALFPRLQLEDFESGDGEFFLQHARNVAEILTNLIPQIMADYPDA